MQVGKNGLTAELLEELTHQLKKRKAVKLRFLKSCVENFDVNELVQLALAKTRARLLSRVGHVIVLAK